MNNLVIFLPLLLVFAGVQEQVTKCVNALNIYLVK